MGGFPNLETDGGSTLQTSQSDVPQSQWWRIAVEVYDEAWKRRRVLRTKSKRVRLFRTHAEASFWVHCNPKYGRRWHGYVGFIVVDRRLAEAWRQKTRPTSVQIRAWYDASCEAYARFLRRQDPEGDYARSASESGFQAENAP
jgi:hypothetical protein